MAKIDRRSLQLPAASGLYLLNTFPSSVHRNFALNFLQNLRKKTINILVALRAYDYAKMIDDLTQLRVTFKKLFLVDY